MIDLFKKQRPPSVLGLSLEGNRLEAVVLRRNGSLQIKGTAAAPLALSPLGGDPQLVGRDIRNQLTQAGIRERRCAVCVPVSWVLATSVKIPDLPEADIASFLQLEAERGFHSGTENLLMSTSRSRAASGEQYATLLAIPRNHIVGLENALKAAQLKPLTFSLGITALDIGDPKAGVLTLALNGHGIDLQVTAGGGILALRSLDSAIDTESGQKRIDAAAVAREIRITLGQLPAELGATVKTIKIFGRGEPARQFVKDIEPRAEAMGLKVESMDRASTQQFSPAPSADFALSPALALAARFVRNGKPGPEFLPPKVQPWRQLLNSKYGSKKLAWAGAAAGVVALGVIGAFGYQQYELSYWRGEWHKIEAPVEEVKTAADQIRKYNPWFDESFRGLRILREMTKAFPEDGVVTAKSVKITDLSAVVCTGVARNRESVLNVITHLGAIDGVTDINPESILGQSPAVQFTFSFQFEGGGASAN